MEQSWEGWPKAGRQRDVSFQRMQKRVNCRPRLTFRGGLRSV